MSFDALGELFNLTFNAQLAQAPNAGGAVPMIPIGDFSSGIAGAAVEVAESLNPLTTLGRQFWQQIMGGAPVLQLLPPGVTAQALKHRYSRGAVVVTRQKDGEQETYVLTSPKPPQAAVSVFDIPKLLFSPGELAETLAKKGISRFTPSKMRALVGAGALAQAGLAAAYLMATKKVDKGDAIFLSGVSKKAQDTMWTIRGGITPQRKIKMALERSIEILAKNIKEAHPDLDKDGVKIIYKALFDKIEEEVRAKGITPQNYWNQATLTFNVNKYLADVRQVANNFISNMLSKADELDRFADHLQNYAATRLSKKERKKWDNFVTSVGDIKGVLEEKIFPTTKWVHAGLTASELNEMKESLIDFTSWHVGAANEELFKVPPAIHFAKAPLEQVGSTFTSQIVKTTLGVTVKTLKTASRMASGARAVMLERKAQNYSEGGALMQGIDTKMNIAEKYYYWQNRWQLVKNVYGTPAAWTGLLTGEAFFNMAGVPFMSVEQQQFNSGWLFGGFAENLDGVFKELSGKDDWVFSLDSDAADLAKSLESSTGMSQSEWQGFIMQFGRFLEEYKFRGNGADKLTRLAGTNDIRKVPKKLEEMGLGMFSFTTFGLAFPMLSPKANRMQKAIYAAGLFHPWQLMTNFFNGNLPGMLMAYSLDFGKPFLEIMKKYNLKGIQEIYKHSAAREELLLVFARLYRGRGMKARAFRWAMRLAGSKWYIFMRRFIQGAKLILYGPQLFIFKMYYKFRQLLSRGFKFLATRLGALFARMGLTFGKRVLDFLTGFLGTALDVINFVTFGLVDKVLFKVFMYAMIGTVGAIFLIFGLISLFFTDITGRLRGAQAVVPQGQSARGTTNLRRLGAGPIGDNEDGGQVVGPPLIEGFGPEDLNKDEKIFADSGRSVIRVSGLPPNETGCPLGGAIVFTQLWSYDKVGCSYPWMTHKYIKGMDLRAAEGTPVYALNGGRARCFPKGTGCSSEDGEGKGFYGETVVIEGNGLRVLYLHLICAEGINGKEVEPGEFIGVIAGPSPQYGGLVENNCWGGEHLHIHGYLNGGDAGDILYCSTLQACASQGISYNQYGECTKPDYLKCD